MNQETRRELESLLTEVLDGAPSPESHARLEHLLRTDWECRRYYLEAVDQHAALLQSPTVSSGRLLDQTAPESMPGRLKRSSRSLNLSRWLPLAAAAVVLVGIGLWAMRPHKAIETAAAPATPVEQTEEGCAVLAQVYGDVNLSAGTIVKPGRLALAGGLARIEFFSGATLLLQGPAELDVHNAWEATCLDGRARVRVPPAAQGFKLLSPGMKVVDLGTEFGLSVDRGSGASEVHVFEGAVEAHPDAGAMVLLKEGTSLRQAGATGVQGVASPDAFVGIAEFDQLASARALARYEAWNAWSLKERNDPRLIAYYIFRHHDDNRWDRLINNVAEPRDKTRLGAAVGARWAQGRWPQKDALEFKGPGDRVRVLLGNDVHKAITLACWVRVDGLDRKYNALLLTDGYEPGEPHWQIDDQGRLMFSLTYLDPSKSDGSKRNQIYLSPSIFNLANQRKWHHIAVTYDNESGTATQYLDGKAVSQEISPFHAAGRPITFGPCEIGNWGLPLPGHKFPIRNLNGRIDEFLIYGSALDAGEIADLYQAGKPD